MTNLQAAADISSPAQISVGNIRLDMAAFRVSIAERPANLSYQEFELLRYLANHSDRVASFSALCSFLWSSEGQKELRRLNVLVCRLRGKLTNSEPYRLETVRGRGYGLLSHHDRSEPAPEDKGGAS